MKIYYINTSSTQKITYEKRSINKPLHYSSLQYWDSIQIEQFKASNFGVSNANYPTINSQGDDKPSQAMLAKLIIDKFQPKKPPQSVYL